MAVVNGDRIKTGKQEQASFRLDLNLDSPNDYSFSEFSYLQLMRGKKKEKVNAISGDNFTTSVPNDSNQQVAAIARKFEEKYGPKPIKKRKRAIHDSDYIDRGYGYDLNDPFVDDSEFYEDFVPDHFDTKLGGFYINTGELEFKAADDINDIDFVVKKKPKIKKHQTPQAILANQKLKKAKQHVALHKTSSILKKSLFPLVTSGHSTTMKPPSSKKPCKKISHNFAKSTPTLAALPAVPINIGEKSVSVPIFPAAIESLTQPSKNVQSPSEVTKNEDQPANKQPLALPENLPPTIQLVISSLIEMVDTDQQQEGKITNKQREGYTQTLLEVEVACKIVNLKTRNAIFEYLAHKLGVARGTLTKRMKQLARKKENDSLEVPLCKLKQAIDISMPKQIVLYEDEVKKVRSESSSSAIDKLSGMEEDTKADDVFDESSLLTGSRDVSSQVLNAVSNSEGMDQINPEQNDIATLKQKRLPRKKYRWADNEEVKKLLCEVVRIKVQSEETYSRLNKEKGEDVVNQFLEDKVKPLWPKGWMQRSILYKLTEPVHRSYTSPSQKKASITVKKKQSGVVKREPGESGSPQQTKLDPPLDSAPASNLGTVSSMSSRLMDVVQTMFTQPMPSNVQVFSSPIVKTSQPTVSPSIMLNVQPHGPCLTLKPASLKSVNQSISSQGLPETSVSPTATINTVELKPSSHLIHSSNFPRSMVSISTKSNMQPVINLPCGPSSMVKPASLKPVNHLISSQKLPKKSVSPMINTAEPKSDSHPISSSNSLKSTVFTSAKSNTQPVVVMDTKAAQFPLLTQPKEANKKPSSTIDVLNPQLNTTRTVAGTSPTITVPTFPLNSGIQLIVSMGAAHQVSTSKSLTIQKSSVISPTTYPVSSIQTDHSIPRLMAASPQVHIPTVATPSTTMTQDVINSKVYLTPGLTQLPHCSSQEGNFASGKTNIDALCSMNINPSACAHLKNDQNSGVFNSNPLQSPVEQIFAEHSYQRTNMCSNVVASSVQLNSSTCERKLEDMDN